MTKNHPFASFVMAGFECAAPLIKENRRLDLLSATRHNELCREDYFNLRNRGIETVREGFNWSRIDKGKGKYDFSYYSSILQAGVDLNVQQIWDLNHFDYPAHLDPFSDSFVIAFAKYAEAVHKLLRRYMPTGELYIVPINEISFFAWIGADRGAWAPYTKRSQRGLAFKKQLVRASIACMKTLKKVDPHIRFIHPDPLMRRVAATPSHNTAVARVRAFNDVIRFEAWDMLSGRTYPELGGSNEYLDIIGVNYYIHNQEWVRSEGKRKVLHQMIEWDNKERISLALMLKQVYERYDRPLLITETGSFGEQRLPWWERTLREIDETLVMRIPLLGVCAYPVLDRPDNAGFLLPKSGLWDFDQNDLCCLRIPHEKTLNMIQTWQDMKISLNC